MPHALSNHVWQSTLFALAAALLTLVFRRNRAHVRYALWTSASLKFLLPFALLGCLGSQLGSRLAVRRLAAPAVSFAAIESQPLLDLPLPALTTPAPSTSGYPLPATLLAIWACGFLAIGARRLRAWRRLRAALRASVALDFPCAIEIRSARGLLEPGVAGWLHPVLLLPEGILDRLTPPQLEAVLAHEVSHARRGDNFFATLHMLVEALFWFHPLVWWIGARMVEERERACDESVLASGAEPRAYADAILNVCKWYVESPLACVAGVAGSNIKRRVESIMTNQIGEALNAARRFLLAAAAAAALAVPLIAGLFTGAVDAPLLAAPPSPAAPPAPQLAAQPPQAPRPRPAQPATAATPQAPEALYQDRRLIVLFFDLGGMSAEEQDAIRQRALAFVRTRLQAQDLVAVMAYGYNGVRVALDFTADPGALETAIRGIEAGPASDAHRLRIAIQTAANMLKSLAGEKLLLCLAGAPLSSYSQIELQDTVDLLQKANVVIYTVDSRGAIPLPAPPSPPSAIFRGKLAYIDTYPAGERQILTIPLDSFTGRVTVYGLVQAASAPPGKMSQGFGGSAMASWGSYQTGFILPAGTYVCAVTVMPDNTHQGQSETFNFEVK